MSISKQRCACCFMCGGTISERIASSLKKITKQAKKKKQIKTKQNQNNPQSKKTKHKKTPKPPQNQKKNPVEKTNCVDTLF